MAVSAVVVTVDRRVARLRKAAAHPFTVDEQAGDDQQRYATFS
jgi:hypothetical protein